MKAPGDEVLEEKEEGDIFISLLRMERNISRTGRWEFSL